MAAAGGLDGGDEPLARFVLGQLGLQADEALHEPGQAVLRLAPLAQDAGEALGRRDAVGRGPIHRHVAVPLQERHQAADLVQDGALLVRGEQVHEAAVVDRPPPVASGGHRALQRIEQVVGIGVDEIDGLADQPEEVLSHPRDARELRPVGALVEGDPEPELPGREAEALLEVQHVRPHEVDEVLAHRRLVVDDEQVVLAEHPSRHPAEERADLGAGELRRHRSGQAGGGAIVHPLEERPQEALERRDVGPDPIGAVDHPSAGRAGEGAQAGLGGDEILRFDCEFREIRNERLGVVAVREGFVAGETERHPLREAPVDRRRHRVACALLVLPRRALGVLRALDLHQVADDQRDQRQDGADGHRPAEPVVPDL